MGKKIDDLFNKKKFHTYLSFLSSFIASYESNTSLNFASATSARIDETKHSIPHSKIKVGLKILNYNATFVILILVWMKFHRLLPERFLNVQRIQINA